MAKRVVIVGAGPGGLAAGMLLARAGLEVTLLERLPQVGGRTAAVAAGGFRFDLGPTFFLYPRVLEEIFAAAGRDLHDAVELVRLDPQYRLVFGGGGELLATPDLPRMEQAIAALCPADAAGLRPFLEDNRAKLAAFEPYLNRPMRGWRDLLAGDLLRMLTRLRPWRSLDAELARYFRDPRVRLAFTFQSKYLGMSPFNCPSLFSILSFLEYGHGVFHPRGGCAAVTEAMAGVVAEFGGEIRLGTPVEGLVFRRRRVVGVRTARGEEGADAVILNADFARAMTRLVPDGLRRRWSDRALAGKRFSCSTFMLYLGVRGRYDRLGHHTIYMARDYRRNLRDIEADHVLSADPSFYVQNPCVTDPGLAPPGHSALYVLVPVPHQHPNIDWARAREPFRAHVLRRLAAVGLHDVEDRIVFEKVVTPADWDAGYEIHLGATFNLAHSLSQMLHRRPQNRFEDLDGVYLVGGGTHPGSGLPVIFKSAQITSRLVLDDLDGAAATDATTSLAPAAAGPALAEVS